MRIDRNLAKSRSTRTLRKATSFRYNGRQTVQRKTKNYSVRSTIGRVANITKTRVGNSKNITHRVENNSIKASPIQWTDFTVNFWMGCNRVSAACKYCYMYRDMRKYGRNPEKVVRTSDAIFKKALKLEGRQRIFTCSWSDFFHSKADSWREDAYAVIRATPQHFWQILTKRPENIKSHLPSDWGNGWEQVWLGVTVENQKCADLRIPQLLKTPSKVKFLSVEPLLGPVKLPHLREIDWVIVGGESGNENGDFRYRPCQVEWLQSIVDQCAAAGVPCFVKQLGTHLYHELNLSDRHGGSNPDEWPEGLRVRHMPSVYEQAMAQVGVQ